MINILRKTTIVALFATALTPLVVDWGHIFAYVFPKVLFFGAVLAVAAIAGSWYYIVGRNDAEGREILERIRTIAKSPLFWALIAFLASMAISAAVGTDPLKSFFGDAERGEGWVMHVHFLVLALFLALFFRVKEWRWYLWGSLGVGVVVFFYGALQYFGIESFPFAQPASARAGSLLGSATYLGSYAIALFFLVGAFLFRVREFIDTKLPQWAPWAIYGGFTALAAITLLLTETRAAMLGFAVGVLTFLIFAMFLPGRLRWGKVSVRALAVLLVVVVSVGSIGFWLTREAPVWDSVPGLSRLSGTQIEGSSLVVRRIALEIAWSAFVERPWFGWGGDNYIGAFQEHYDPEHFKHSADWLDRAHNKIAGTAVMYGGVGLVLYLLVLATLLWEVARVVRLTRHSERSEESRKSSNQRDSSSQTSQDDDVIKRLAGAVVISALVAYFVQNLAAFDMPTSYIPLFVLVGFLWHLRIRSSRHSERSEESRKSSNQRDSSSSFLRMTVTVLAVILILASLWALYAIRWVPYRQSLAHDDLLNKGASAIVAEQARLYEPWSYLQPTLRQRMLQSVQESGGASNSQLAEVADLASAKLAEEAERHVDARPFQLLANFNIDRAKAINPQYYVEAEQWARKGVERMSERPSLRYILAVTLSAQGKHGEAIELLQETVRLEPSVPQSYYYLGSALAAKGEEHYSLGEEYLDKAIELGLPLQVGDYINLTRFYLTFESWDKASVLAEWAFERVEGQMSTTNKVQLHTNAILAYRGLRDAENVIRHAEGIYEVAEQPDLKRDAQFIIELMRQERWDVLDQL